MVGEDKSTTYKDRRREGVHFVFLWRREELVQWTGEKREQPRCQTPP